MKAYSCEECATEIARLTRTFLLPRPEHGTPAFTPYYLNPLNPKINLPGLTMLALFALWNAHGKKSPDPKKLLDIAYYLNGHWQKRMSTMLNPRGSQRTATSTSRWLSSLGATQFYLQTICQQEPGLSAKTRWMTRHLLDDGSQLGTSPTKSESLLDTVCTLFFLNCSSTDAIFYSRSEMPELFKQGHTQLSSSSSLCKVDDIQSKMTALVKGLAYSENEVDACLPLAMAYLSRYPLVKIDNAFVSPVQHYLLAHLHDGFYYKILTSSGESAAHRMGSVYPAYLRELLAPLRELGHDIDIDPDQTYAAYYKKKRPDFIIRDDDAVVLIETKAARLPLAFRATGAISKLGTVLKQFVKAAKQLDEFAIYLRDEEKETREIYPVIAFWENLWYWFVGETWRELKRTIHPRSLDIEKYIITGLRGLEKLVSMREASAQGKAVSDVNLLKRFLSYSTKYKGKWRLASAQLPCDLDEYATTEYLEKHPNIEVEQPQKLRDINNAFVDEYLKRLNEQRLRTPTEQKPLS